MAELRAADPGPALAAAGEGLGYEDGPCDVAWPSAPEDHEAFGLAVCEAVRVRGHCLVEMPSAEEERRRLLQLCRNLGDYALPRPEFEEAYLGRGAESKVAWLHGAPGLQEPGAQEALAPYCQRAAELAMAMGPLLRDFLGFAPWGALAGSLLRVPMAGWERQELTPWPLTDEDVAAGAVEQHLDFVQRRRLCFMYLIETQGGSIQLHPRGDLGLQTMSLPLTRETLLVFRHDLIAYTYQPSSGSNVVLQAWLLEEPQQLRLDGFEGDQASMEAIVGGPPMATENQVHIMCGHCRFPGRGYPIESAWNAWQMQTDCFVEIPVSRWDMSAYYSADANAVGKALTKHAAMLDISEMIEFDNAMFGLTDREASLIVPGQRLLLEVSLEAFHLGLGATKRSLVGRPIACVVADIGADWDHFYGKVHEQEWLKVGGAGYSFSSSARMGHTFGLTGPMHQVDTACSASLVGANVLHALMRKPEKGVTEGIMMGYMNYFTPWPFIGLSSAGMLGRTGRSQTFDQAANGYARGEGIGGLVLKRSGDVKCTQERQACYMSSFINQDGRSASLTAPNGPSQQACMRSSMRDSQLRPEDVAITENHGTGTALGDPIEVGSIRSVFRKRGERGLPVTSGKSHMGHLEAGAGSVGLLKTLTSLLHACVPPNVHLRDINAHIEYEGFPSLFPIEPTDIGFQSAVGGLNSFGFGGTNSRAELWARCQYGHRETSGWWLQVEKLDCVTVACPRCLGPMCWLCGVAVPSAGRMRRHHCAAVREDLASYEYCSNCYGGGYQHGGALADAPDRGEGVCVIGTWSAWTALEAMEEAADGSYAFDVRLGDTLLERFRLLVGRDRRRAIYPAASRAGQTVRVLGPDGLGDGKDWQIDGRLDGVPAGTVYRVTFEWGDLQKSVRWQVAPQQAAAPPGAPCYRHSYQVCGSLTGWRLAEMTPHPEEAGCWEFVGRVVAKRGASFSFLRDRDEAQAIWPLESEPADDSVPVMGPADGAPGKESSRHWLASGAVGEAVAVRLRVVDGEITVTASSTSVGEVAWRSPSGGVRDLYYVVGSWNAWTFSDWGLCEMERGGAATDVQRFRFAIGPQGREEFQVVANRDWALRLHPLHARAPPGLSLVCGPDAQGDGLNWLVAGPVGQLMEVQLDLAAEDHCGVVSCQPCELGEA